VDGDEFGDLDNLLEGNRHLGSGHLYQRDKPLRAVKPEVPTSCRQAPRRAPLEQMMRVPVEAIGQRQYVSG